MYFNSNNQQSFFYGPVFYPVNCEGPLGFYQPPFVMNPQFFMPEQTAYNEEPVTTKPKIEERGVKTQDVEQNDTDKSDSLSCSSKMEVVKEQAEQKDEQERAEFSERLEVRIPEKKPKGKNKNKFGKKNSESNVVNQIFSFMFNQKKSQRIVQKLLGYNKQRVKIFYIFINKVKYISKKYLNRYYLFLLATMDESSPYFDNFRPSVRRLKKLSIQEFTKIVRILVNNYLKGGHGASGILISRKIGQYTQLEHLRKLRELTEFCETDIFSQSVGKEN